MGLINIVLSLLLIQFTISIRLPNHGELFESFDQALRVPYKDFVKSVLIFRAGNLGDFQPIVLDEERHQLIVGARDAVLRLKSNNLALIQRTDLSSSSYDIKMCVMKGQSKAYCHNFIRTLVLYKENILVCGTNAYSPTCVWRKAKDLDEKVEAEFSGIGVVPYSPDYNSTYVMTKDGHLYTGLVTDFSGHDPALLRILPSTHILRTAKANTGWINNPSFVAAYEIGNFIYFFFRETAIESASCGTETLSRVARICKNDVGGDVMLEDYFTTFNKATLTCSSDGVSYTRLQSVHLDKKSGVFFAAFTSDNSALPGSALCSYDMNNIRKAFTGPYLYQNRHSSWIKHPNSHMYFDCEVHGVKSMLPGLTMRRLVDAQKYQLMSNTVQPALERPLNTAPIEKYSHIVVDSVRVKHYGTVQTLFVMTEAGLLKKFVILPESADSDGSACLIEVIQVFQPQDQVEVTDLKIDHKQDGILIGTKKSIIKLPTHRCNRFKTRQQCLDAEDPYCGWNSRTKQCSGAPEKITSHHYWHQNLDSCPKINFPVDGKYGQWSLWFQCAQMNDDGLNCLCRTRKCDSPKPRLGGRNCQGPYVQVQNCTRHGDWTVWSDWSACSATCGMSTSRRNRYCSNPSPAYGGRMCLGVDSEQQFCKQTPCPVVTEPPVHGYWSVWGSWDTCTRRCGGGIQRRIRNCNNPTPMNNGNDCNGCDTDYRVCNTEPCEELRRWSDWTPWLAANGTTAQEGVWLKRFKFSCRARIDDPKLLSVSSARSETKLCAKGASDCTDSGFAARDGGWSQWTRWSECSQICGNEGIQTRIRTCTEPTPIGGGEECEGHAKEQRQCNAHSCQATWSCWNEYSPCSVSCGPGVKHRVRKCERSPGMTPCEGKRVETLTCNSGPCSQDGFGIWSSWSACSELEVKVRIRPCISSTYCNGIPDAQMKRCRRDGNALSSEYKSSSIADDIPFILSIFGAFIVGVILTIILSCWAVRRQSNCCYMFAKKPNRPTLHPTPPSPSKSNNIYTPPPTRNNVQLAQNGHIHLNPLVHLLTSDKNNSDVAEWTDEELASLTLRRTMRTSMNTKDFL